MNASRPDDPKPDRLTDPMRKAPIVTGARSPDHRAAAWQIVATGIAAIAIIAIVFFGLNSQRDENKPGGEQSAVTQVTPSAPQGGGNAPAAQGNQKQANQQQAAPSNQPAPQQQQNAQQNGQQQAAPAQNSGQSQTPSTTGQASGNGGNNQDAGNNQNASGGRAQ